MLAVTGIAGVLCAVCYVDDLLLGLFFALRGSALNFFTALKSQALPELRSSVASCALRLKRSATRAGHFSQACSARVLRSRLIGCHLRLLFLTIGQCQSLLGQKVSIVGSLELGIEKVNRDQRARDDHENGCADHSGNDLVAHDQLFQQVHGRNRLGADDFASPIMIDVRRSAATLRYRSAGSFRRAFKVIISRSG